MYIRTAVRVTRSCRPPIRRVSPVRRLLPIESYLVRDFVRTVTYLFRRPHVRHGARVKKNPGHGGYYREIRVVFVPIVLKTEKIYIYIRRFGELGTRSVTNYDASTCVRQRRIENVAFI